MTTSLISPTATRWPQAASLVRPAPAYCSEFRPLDYARLVHPKGGVGSAMFGDRVPPRKPRKDGSTEPRWSDLRYSSHALASRDVDLQGRRFMSFASYPYSKPGEPRVAKDAINIVSLGASWLDLDYYNKPDWKDVPPRKVLEAVRNICEDRGWPSPSYATFSGRGILVVWLYTASQPAQRVMARHRALQQILHEEFLPFGSDYTAKAATKQFRMPGTYNEKSGLPVVVIFPDLTAEIARIDFDELCRVVLPFQRQTKAQREAAKAEAKAKRTAAQLANRTPREGHHGAKLTGSSYWDTIAADLDRLYALRHGKAGIKDTAAREDTGAGRNSWLVAFVYVASWRLPASDLDAYVIETADRLGLDHASAKSKACSIVGRAKESARGVRRTYRGFTVDPRYKPSPAHLRDLLVITPREMRRADLRILIDQARRSENAVSRVVASRRAAGVRDRSVQQQHRLEVGQQAVEFLAEGLTVKAVAELYGVSPRWLDNALRDARAVAGITTAKAEPVVAPVVTVDDVGDTLDLPVGTPAVIAHEVLRDIRETAREAVVAGRRTQYVPRVTTKGSTLLGQTPAARPTARRASTCPASEMEVA
ncbi:MULTISPECIES: hypothetical protein [Methylobacteriaceae]|uniref:Uncharacterized protein n=2 Tax=Methylobacterium TaxID=407 RepID=A0ABV2L884_9HYPH|nr:MULTISPECIES: hypothetical protein [Methylobacteriaceae]UYW33820.1 hypothetical protein OKB92_06995 [Methylorubrum extorquens]GJD74506.1 hypothetical protein CFIICLFH_2740 [Methylobacterium goesingense]